MRRPESVAASLKRRFSDESKETVFSDKLYGARRIPVKQT